MTARKPIADMTAEDVMALPVRDVRAQGHGLTPIESRHDPIGWLDSESKAWRIVLAPDGESLQREQM